MPQVYCVTEKGLNPNNWPDDFYFYSPQSGANGEIWALSNVLFAPGTRPYEFASEYFAAPCNNTLLRYERRDSGARRSRSDGVYRMPPGRRRDAFLGFWVLRACLSGGPADRLVCLRFHSDTIPVEFYNRTVIEQFCPALLRSMLAAGLVQISEASE
jgi:hypothetical protein